MRRGVGGGVGGGGVEVGKGERWGKWGREVGVRALGMEWGRRVTPSAVAFAFALCLLPLAWPLAFHPAIVSRSFLRSLLVWGHSPGYFLCINSYSEYVLFLRINQLNTNIKENNET